MGLRGQRCHDSGQDPIALRCALLIKFHLDDQIQQNVVGGAYGVFGEGGQEKCYSVLEGRPEEKRPVGILYINYQLDALIIIYS